MLTFVHIFLHEILFRISSQKIENFFCRNIGITMSGPQEYIFTAHPKMPECQGENCYCFHGRNQMDASISDSEEESLSQKEEPSIRIYYGDDEWQILKNESAWTVALNQMRFHHPRVLLAYFRFISLHNEIAQEGEHIQIPEIPGIVVDFILGHISFQNPPPEFKEDVEELKARVLRLKEQGNPLAGIYG